MTLIRDALAQATRTAFHLEHRDAYAVSDVHRPSYEAFTQRGEVDTSFMNGWATVVREATGRGVEFRRLRIVSEPLSDYIRWEHALTAVNVAAGEQVRWLSRRTCPPVAVVPFDCWIIDSNIVLVNHFAGNGTWPEPGVERRTDPELVKITAESFDAAWTLAVPHGDYIPK